MGFAFRLQYILEKISLLVFALLLVPVADQISDLCMCFMIRT